MKNCHSNPVDLNKTKASSNEKSPCTGSNKKEENPITIDFMFDNFEDYFKVEISSSP